MKRSGLGGIVAVGLVALASARTVEAGEPRLVVGVCNTAKVPSVTLRPAMAAAEEIFRKAGVETEWIEREDSSDRPVALNLRILLGGSRNPNAPDALGNAFMTGTSESSNLADVYYGLLKERVYTSADLTTLLANVMAHEVGHLLGAKHSPEGLMRGQWGGLYLRMSQTTQLSFSSDQARRLRTEVAARLGLAVVRPSGLKD